MCSCNPCSKVERAKSKIEYAMIRETDDWSEGLNIGLAWALRVLNGDKSAD